MSAETPIVDLHCDLLAFLEEDDRRTPDDPRARCSLPQLQDGGVRFQVLAMFTRTLPGSSRRGLRQAQKFAALCRDQPGELARVREARGLHRLLAEPSRRTGVVAAIENASGFCEEGEPLAAGFERLREIDRLAGPLLYVSLTWNDENRFGGGNGSTAGLKDDGRRLVDRLAEMQVAVDLSHTSDALAAGLFDHADRQRLPLRFLASHSNFRSMLDTARNLPDELAQELAHRGGIQGMNFMAPFLGPDDADNLFRQMEFGAKRVGGDRIALGADFFCSDDLPREIRRRLAGREFFDGFENSSCYPRVLEGLRQRQATLDADAICWRNAVRFVEELWADRR